MKRALSFQSLSRAGFESWVCKREKVVLRASAVLLALKVKPLKTLGALTGFGCYTRVGGTEPQTS